MYCTVLSYLEVREQTYSTLFTLKLHNWVCACSTFQTFQFLMAANACGVALGTKAPSAANLSTIWASLPQIARSEHLHRCRTCMHHYQAKGLVYASTCADC